MRAGNISLYSAKRYQTPVAEAATLEENLQLDPHIAPMVEWCKAWIRTNPLEAGGGDGLCGMYGRMQKAYQLGAATTPDSPPSNIRYTFASLGSGFMQHSMVSRPRARVQT